MDLASPTTTHRPSSFLGREHEWEELIVRLAACRQGRGSLHLIVGEPGIGKTRLADEFVRRAREEGAHTLWGRCWEGGGAPAFWPWVQILRAQLRTVEGSVARNQLGRGAADIAQILPDAAQYAEGPPREAWESDSGRFQLFDSIVSFLRAVGEDRESVIVIDDLHAADTPSILLLRFLATQLLDMRLMVLATVRDVTLTPDHPLSTAIGEMLREPSTRLLSLSGLAEKHVAGLLTFATGAAPSARLARELWRETNGNPLFLNEAARLLMSEGQLERGVVSGGLRRTIPPAVHDVIARRVDRLSSSAASALAWAAVAGPEFSTEMLHRVADRPADELRRAFDDAVQAGLLVEAAGGPGRLRFSHGLVREAIYQSQPPVARSARHRRIAEELEANAGDANAHLAELTHHFVAAAAGAQAADVGDLAERGRRYAIRAGHAAARSLAYEEAARLFQIALSMLDLEGSTDDRGRADVLLALGDVDARAGEIASAAEAFRAAADVARRTGDAGHLARAALGIGGRLPWERPGGNADLIPHLEEALMMLGGADRALRVRLLARLACAWRSSPDKRRQSDMLSREAIQLARALDDRATLSYALAARFWAVWWPENPDERVRLAREMLEVSRALGDAERMVDAELMLWLSHLELGLMGDAKRQFERVRRVAEELRQPAQLWLGVAPRVLMALMEGDFAAAEVLADQESGRGAGNTLARDDVSAAAFHRYLLGREHGTTAAMESEVRAAADEFPWYPLHRAAHCLVLLDSGREREARASFGLLARDEFAVFYRDNEWLLGVSLAAEIAWRLADERAAAILYAQLLPFAGRHAVGSVEGSLGAVDRYLGLLAWTLGLIDEAERHFRAAVERNEQMGARPWAAHSRADLASALRTRADRRRDEAQQLERHALATATELGMSALATRLAEVGRDDATNQGPIGDPQIGTFRREGDVWAIAFGADRFSLRNARGLEHLAVLLADPHREHLSIDLARRPSAGALPAAPGADAAMTVTDGPEGLMALDEEARRAYRERLRDLHEEVAEAQSWNDPERAANAQREIDFLARELARAVGIGGRHRTVGSVTERARVSVTRAIRHAMGRIASESPSLGAHLDATIHTGTYCAYRPDPRLPIQWQT